MSCAGVHSKGLAPERATQYIGDTHLSKLVTNVVTKSHPQKALDSLSLSRVVKSSEVSLSPRPQKKGNFADQLPTKFHPPRLCLYVHCCYRTINKTSCLISELNHSLPNCDLSTPCSQVNCKSSCLRNQFGFNQTKTSRTVFKQYCDLKAHGERASNSSLTFAILLTL